MKHFDVVDLVIVAGQTLGTGTSAALNQVDIPAARAVVAEAGCRGRVLADQESAAEAGIALMVALLRHRPFPTDGDRIAVAAGLQLLSMHGWQAELDPTATAAVAAEALAGGRLSQAAAAEWLSPRLTSDRRRRDVGPKPASVAYPQALLFIQAGCWALVTLSGLAVSVGAMVQGEWPIYEAVVVFLLSAMGGGLATAKAALGRRVSRVRSKGTRWAVILTELAMTCFGLLLMIVPSPGEIVFGFFGAVLSLVAVLCMLLPGNRQYFTDSDPVPGSPDRGGLPGPAAFWRSQVSKLYPLGNRLAAV